jgi:hypothetical protein
MPATPLVTGLMIQDLLDHVGLNTDVGQAGGDAASDVVVRPRLQAKFLIQRSLADGPAGEPVFPTKQEVEPIAAGRSIQ